jgi:hypothetical protein
MRNQGGRTGCPEVKDHRRRRRLLIDRRAITKWVHGAPWVLLLALLAPRPAAGGTYYKATTATEPATGKPGPAMIVEGWVDQEKARVVFRQSTNPLTPAGSYLLTTDGGRVVFLVDPQKQTYAEWDVAAMLRSIGSILETTGGMVKLEVEAPQVSALEEQDGGLILGLPTRHYRVRTSYTMKLKILGIGRAMDIEASQDIWATADLEDAALGLWLRNDQLTTGNDDLDRLLRAETAAMVGFPLKVETVTTQSSGKKGKSSITRTVTTVDELRQERIDPSYFVLDPSFKRQEMSPAAFP